MSWAEAQWDNVSHVSGEDDKYRYDLQQMEVLICSGKFIKTNGHRHSQQTGKPGSTNKQYIKWMYSFVERESIFFQPAPMHTKYLLNKTSMDIFGPQRAKQTKWYLFSKLVQSKTAETD